MKKNNVFYTLIISACLALVFNSCKKGSSDQTTTPPDGLEEQPSAEQLQILDNAPDVKLKMSDIVLPNGQIASDFLPDYDSAFFRKLISGSGDADQLGPLSAKNMLIKQLTALALNLADRSKHQYSDEGPDKPAQNGIVYSYGSKDFTIRQKPGLSKCDGLVYGLDCSGMLYQLFYNAGVTSFPKGNADNQRQVSTIQNALNTSFPNLKKIKVEDLGRLDAGKIENGDIVYFRNDKSEVGHIGMILKNKSGDLVLFQSNGVAGGSSTECDKNRGLSRGPRTIKLDNSYWFGAKSDYGVVRFNFEIEGKWEFSFKCSGSQTVLFQLDLDFPPSENKEFTINQPFTDYDGSPNNASFDFKYDNTTNQLSCEFIITDGWINGFERKDSFTITLQNDDSGFVTADQIYIHNGTGCVAEVRLVNKG